MSRHYKQMQHGGDEARRLLHERLAREEMGDAAYEEMISHADNRAFKIFGLVFIVGFGVFVFWAAARGW